VVGARLGTAVLGATLGETDGAVGLAVTVGVVVQLEREGACEGVSERREV
jgi:hypothetical protein